MKQADDLLMAYADGELDDAGRRQIELAMQSDPGIAARVRQHQELRQKVQRAYDRILEAPLPPHLAALAELAVRRPPPMAGAVRPAAAPAAPAARPKVIQLDSVRATRRQPGARPPPSPVPARGWPQWAALAVSMLLGIAGGIMAVVSFHSETQFAAINGNGLLRANGKLDSALDSQLASAAQPRGSLRIGVSFVGRDGQYCRAFELGAGAGLACRAGAGWNIPVFVEGQGASGSYRPVGSPLPDAILAAIDARAVGPSLDAAAEKAAAARGWTR